MCRALRGALRCSKAPQRPIPGGPLCPFDHHVMCCSAVDCGPPSENDVDVTSCAKTSHGGTCQSICVAGTEEGATAGRQASGSVGLSRNSSPRSTEGI